MAVLSLSNLKKTWYYLQKNGIKEAVMAAAERIGQEKQITVMKHPIQRSWNASGERQREISGSASWFPPSIRKRSIWRLCWTG